MSKLSKGLESSSRIYNDGVKEFKELDGAGTGATTYVAVLKQPEKVHITSLRFNDATGAGGDFSVAVVRRGYNPASGGRATSLATTSRMLPTPTDTDNDWDTLAPDISAYSVTQAQIKAFRAPIAANEIYSHDNNGTPVLILEPYDELWIAATATVNYAVIYY